MFLPYRNSQRQGRAARRDPSRSGTAATELAILLPLITGLCLACVDIGRFGYAYVSLSHAAQAGANCGASHGFTDYSYSDWEAAVEDAITEEMAGMAGFDPNNLVIGVQTTEEANGLQRIAIDLTYPFPLVVSWPGLQNPIPLRRRVTTLQYQ